MTTQKIFYVSYGQLRLFSLATLTDHSHDYAWRYYSFDAFPRTTHHTMCNLRATTSSFLIIVSLRHWRWLDVSWNVCEIMEFVLNMIL